MTAERRSGQTLKRTSLVTGGGPNPKSRGRDGKGAPMLRISSNLASFAAQRAMRQTDRDVGTALKELSQGTRFVTPGADPAGYAIAENLAAQTKGFQAALRNTENASSFIQVAEGALSEQNNILIRLRELAIQAASDTFSDTERGFLDDEFQQLVQEFDRIARSTKYGSQPLLDGSTKEYEFQVGVHKGDNDVIRYTNDTNTTASNLDIAGLGVGDKGDARDSLESIDEALVEMNSARAKLGAIQSRMEMSINHIQSQVENVGAAYSRMAETNIPEAVARVRRGQVLHQYQAAAMAVSNENHTNLLRLIG